MIAPNTPVLEDVRNEFTAFLPELSGRLSRRFRHRGPEARAEAVAEGVAHAWVLYVSASRRQKCVTPGTLAHYAGDTPGLPPPRSSRPSATAGGDGLFSTAWRPTSISTPSSPVAAFASSGSSR
ncbi:MAG: hypothetical protein NTV86_03915 [Planctomycetota bacterium]|nr:hypothetical protein [Planctomycetota bacterium]